MAPLNSDVSNIPLELVQQITSSLPHSALRSLCGAGSTFGPQRTSDLATRLTIPISSIHPWRLRCPARKDRLSHVHTVTISGADQQAPAPSDGSADTRMSLVLFIVRTGSSMPQLTQLHLHDLPLSTLIPAAACLCLACPHLACVKLRGVCSEEAAEGAAPQLADLWAELAAVASLRRLKVTRLAPADLVAGMPGIGALCQLHSRSLPRTAVHASELAQLSALRKVTLGEVLRAGGLAVAGPCGLLSLECLKIDCKPQDDPPESPPDLSAFSSSPRLTRLKLEEGYAPSLDTFLPSCHGLVLLHANLQEVSYTLLAAMPLLRELQCDGLWLPPAGAGCALPSLLCVDCGDLLSPEGGQPPQSVATTFPQLLALKVAGTQEDTFLWPSGAAGHLPHLRALGARPSCLSPALAQCASSVQHLFIGHIFAPTSEEVVPDPIPGLRLLGEHLLKLTLFGAGTLSDSTFITAVSSCPLVEEVTIRRVPHITNVGLAALSRAPRLRCVTLVGCGAVSGDGVAMLASRWSVECIEVCGCDGVSAEDVARVQALLGRPQLSLIFTRVDSKPWMVPVFRTP